MSKVSKTHVSPEDQQEINEFARVHKRLNESKAEIRMLSNELQNIAESCDEVCLLDDSDGLIAYQIGDSFVYFDADETNERLDYSKEKIQTALDGLHERLSEVQKKHDELKSSLYSKFGDNIGLETDD